MINTIYVDNCDTILTSDSFPSNFPSRHAIVTATIDVFHPINIKSNITYKPLNTITSNDLNIHLNKLDWSAFTASDDNFNIELGLTSLTSNLQNTIDTLALEKTISSRKSDYPWMNSDLRLLKSKCEATNRRYRRTSSRTLLDEFLALTRSYEDKLETARCAYMHNRICSSLDANRNFWKDMRELGLIPKTNDSLHGFLPAEMCTHFSNISISQTEDPKVSLHILQNASPDGFSFKFVTVNDVILAVSHFRSQAK